ncbi:MAG: D-alanyl-D-alanine carboxypeptidase [Firmicutes bacterium HGW-Firmicutes-12]|jgi:D-alanyl-D-alanine carboxypeptidase (penicillin-binding protein 5/6)|nr:MAG: D-alanyl-D-alanine carboxypeptidase [Firmicutes bacterium HGW-Firmicutes-12]
MQSRGKINITCLGGALFLKKKRYFNIFCIVLLLSFLVPYSALAVELPLKASSAILLDAQSGKILYEKDAHKVSYPASMTKIMTLILAAEAIEQGKIKLTDVVTASEKASSYGGSQIFLAAGEKLTLKELLLGIALASGNDASVAVAEYIAGTHEAFVDMMNEKAAELGLKNTHFVNCNGLHDPEHYSTAYDFAQLGLLALKYPLIRELSTVKHYRIREETSRPFQYDNKNKLLWTYEGADGFKTGWTVDAKYCLTATCERDGLRFVSVVTGVPIKSGHFADAKVLFDWGYSQFTFKKFYEAADVIGSVEVGKGVVDTVEVVPENKVGITVLKGEDKDLRAEVEIEPVVDSPVHKGQVVGHVSIMRGEEVLNRMNLVTKESVEKGSWWREFKKVLKASLAG